MYSGFFITVEGTEGAGKSSCLSVVSDTLQSLGIEPVLTREPGGTPYAESIRELLLKDTDEPVAPMAELLLMFAARAQHIEQKIRPSLDAGRVVVSDRFTDATFAYQGVGRGLGTEAVCGLETMVQQGLTPDLTLLLDLPVDVGLARMSARGEPDRIEKEKVSFFEAVREGYLARVAQEPQRFLVIDASQPLEQVQADIRRGLTERLMQREQS
ncbi:MAG: dTMP kinase [Pontibacterium sp.]